MEQHWGVRRQGLDRAEDTNRRLRQGLSASARHEEWNRPHELSLGERDPSDVGEGRDLYLPSTARPGRHPAGSCTPVPGPFEGAICPRRITSSPPPSARHPRESFARLETG